MCGVLINEIELPSSAIQCSQLCTHVLMILRPMCSWFMAQSLSLSFQSNGMCCGQVGPSD